MASGGDLSLKIILQAQDLMSSALDTATKSLDTFGGKMALVGGMALVAGIQAVQSASQFQGTMLKVQALAGVSAKDANAASDAIINMAGKVGQSPQKLADGLYYIASAGYSAKDSLQILEASAKAASVGMTDTQTVANAVTASMKAMNIPASEINHVMDVMTKTVSTGKTEWADYATVIGKISLNASQAKVSFNEANAAFATLTNVMPTSKAAADSLNALLQTSSRFDLLTSRAKALHITFDTAKYKTLDFVGKLRYLQEVTGGNAETIAKLLGRQNAQAAMTALLTGGAQGYTDALKGIDGASEGAGAAQDAFAKVQQGLEFRMQQARAAVEALSVKVGTMLLPVLSDVMGVITPLIDGFTSWISNMDHARPVLIGLGVAIAVGLLPVVWSLAAGVIAATWPFLLIAGAVAGAVAIFQHFYETSAPFKQFIDNLVRGVQQFVSMVQENFIPTMKQIGTWLQANVLPILQQIGNFLASTFQPVWQNLVNLWNSQLLPLFKQLWGAIQPALPALKLLGALLLGVVGVAFVLLIGIIAGVIRAIATVLSDIASAIGGIVQIITGIVQVVMGIVRVIYDIFTGNFKDLGSALGSIWQGILNIFGGVFQVLGSLLHAVFGGIASFLGGFTDTVLGIFTGFKTKTSDVWHGITSAIGGFFSGLGTKVHDMLSGIGQGIGNFFSGLGSMVHQGLQNLLNNFLAPFRAIGNLFSWLYNHNRYFKMLVDKIHAIVAMGLAILQARWQQFTNWLHSLWQGIVDKATTIWQSVSGAITKAVNTVVDWLKNIWNTATGWLADKWNGFKDLAAKAWQAVSGVFGGIWGTYIAGPLGNLWKSLSDWFGNLAKNALDWGKNLIQGFIDGIKNMLGNLGQTLGNVAQNVKNFLGFHSPTKEGPGSESDVWAPNLIKMFSAGLASGAPQIQAALNTMIHPLATVMAPPALLSNAPASAYGASTTYNSAGGNAHYGNNSIIIQTQPGQNPQQIANEVMAQLSKMYRRSGVMGNIAAGGRSS